MNPAELIQLLVRVSILMVAFGFGLNATWSEATYAFRHPGNLFRAFLAMNVAMLLFVVMLVKLFPLHPAVRLALFALALSPVPPFLPSKELKAGGEQSYVYGVLVGMAVLAIVAVPVLVPLIGKLFNLDLKIAPQVIAKVLLLTILVPLGTGVAVRAWKPATAAKLAKWVLKIGNVLLLLGGICILLAAWPSILSLVGNGSILAIAAFSAVGLMVGHLLARPGTRTRTSLALATSSRHPAVALAIAQATFPEEKRVLAAVLLYLIVSTLVSIPYLQWRKHHPGIPGDHGGPSHWKHRHA